MNYENFEDEEMDMPIVCQHCGEIFDLNDGCESQKWYPNITICEKCHEEEDDEIVQDEVREMINTEISNALYIENNNLEDLVNMMSPENRELILRLASLCVSLPSVISTEYHELIQRMVGKSFRHTNGNIYTVLCLTNTNSTPERMLEYPVSVIYMGQNGKTWSRKLSDWDRSFASI